MSKKYLWIAVAAVVLVGVFSAGAQQLGSLRRTHAQNFFIRHLIADLNITDDQRASIKQVLVEERPALQALATKAEQAREELKSMGAFDESKVRTVAQSNSATYVDFIAERERIKSRIFAILTPDQRTKVNTMIEQFHEGMQDRISQLGDNL